MKSWGYNKNKTSVWIYDKEHRFDESVSDWTVETKPTTNINALNCFHDLKAGYMHLPEDALVEIFAALDEFVISNGDVLLDSYEKMNSNYYDFDNWVITSKDGHVLNGDEKELIHTYLKESRYTFVETEWAHTYENDWGNFIQTFYSKAVQLRTDKDNGIISSLSIGDKEIYQLIRYSVIYNWRSISGNELFNDALENPMIDFLRKIEIPENERVYEDDLTEADAFIHSKRIKDFIEFLKKDDGLIKKNIDANYSNLIPYIYLTDASRPFITSNEPSFTYERKDGMKEMIFVALPQMLISFCRGEHGKFYIENATAQKVEEYNKVIASRGNMLILPCENYDIKSLFT